MLAVRIDNIAKRFGAVQVLRGISLTVEQSSLVTLLGPSGCGKTTLLRMIAGLEAADHGSIQIGERVVSDARTGIFVPPAQRNIGMVFQSYALWPHKRIWENVAYPLAVRKVPSTKRKERALEALRLVQLDGLHERFPGELSGGQQQRVALARAIVYEPDVLLLDEPLSNLDAKLRAEMRYEIRELQKRCKLTTVYVTHDQEEAFVISDRICLMNGGALEQVGGGVELYENPSSPFAAAFLGAANRLDGEIVGLDERGSAHVRIGPAWFLQVRNREDPVVVGAKVSVLVRPHEIRLDPAGSAVNGAAPGTVRATTYLGGSTEYIVDLADTQVRVREVGRPRFSTDDDVIATITEMRPVLLSSVSPNQQEES
jgi:iron(III) transport system ATP-binding protein